ncbi:MAG TPA: hypothetical protein VGB22_08645 [candidate division Zixibacteria bacterium]|jgi:hypothetical protein
MLKRLTPYLLAAMIACAATTAWAIDAKPKEEKPAEPSPSDQTTTQPVKDAAPKAVEQSTPPNDDLLNRLQKQVEKSGDSKAGQYDNYIDKNKDGVDDRVKCKSQHESTRTKTATESKANWSAPPPQRDADKAPSSAEKKPEPDKKSPDRKRPRR